MRVEATRSAQLTEDNRLSRRGVDGSLVLWGNKVNGFQQKVEVKVLDRKSVV